MEKLFAYLSIILLSVLLVSVYLIVTSFQHISKLKIRIRDNLRYICILIETVYTYKNNPQQLRDHLLQEMTIKKLLCYHIVEEDESLFPPDMKCTQKDKLLYKLHLEGFTSKELCILFELNNLNTVYVKCHRVNKKLNPSEQGDSDDSQ